MRQSHLFLFAAIGVLGIACTTSNVDTSNDVQTQGGGNTGGTSAAGAGGSATAGSAGTGGSDTAGSGGTGVAGSAGTGGAGGSAPTSLVRFVHLVPDAGAYDICFRPCPNNDCKQGTWSDATVQGPIFSGNKDANQFYYPGVSVFFEPEAGTYELRTVDGAATNCATAATGVTDTAQSFIASHSYTYALIGTVAQGVSVTFSDEPSFPFDGKVGYHVFNALTATGNVDFGINESTGFVSLAMAVKPFAKSTAVEDIPSTGSPAFIASGTTSLVAGGVSQTSKANEEYSVFIYGTKLGDTKTPPGVAVCWDNDPSGAALMGTTTIANCKYQLPRALPDTRASPHANRGSEALPCPRRATSSSSSISARSTRS